MNNLPGTDSTFQHFFNTTLPRFNFMRHYSVLGWLTMKPRVTNDAHHFTNEWDMLEQS